MKRMLAVAAIAILPLVVGGPADALTNYPTEHNSTTGAQADCDLITYITYVHDDTAQITCDISDTLADGDSVYVEWWQDGFGHVQLKNENGSGTTVHRVDARFNPDGSFETVYWKVCRDISFYPDNCSSTKQWVVH